MGNLCACLCDPCEQRYLAKTNVDIDDNDSDVENLRDDMQRISTNPKNQADHIHLSSDSLRSHESPHANRGMIKQISIESIDDGNTPPPPPPPPDDELPKNSPYVKKAISESAARQQLTNIWVKQDTLEQSKSDNRARIEREEREQARSPGLSPQSTAREFSWAAAAGNTEHSQEREMSHTWGAAQAKRPSPLLGSTRSPRDSPFFPALDTIDDHAPMREFQLSPRREDSMSRSFTPSAYHTFASRPTRKQKRRSMPAARLTKSLERVRGQREKRSTLFGTQLGVGTQMSIAQQAKAVSAAIDGDIMDDDDDEDMMDDEMLEREAKFLSSFPLRRQSSTAVPETRAEYRSLKKDEGFVHRLSQFQDDVRRYSEHVREMKVVDDAVRKEMDEENKSGALGDGRMVRFNSVLTFHEFVRRTSSFLQNDDEKIGRANTLPVKFGDERSNSREMDLNIDEGFKSTRDRKGTGFPMKQNDVVAGRDEKMDSDVVS